MLRGEGVNPMDVSEKTSRGRKPPQRVLERGTAGQPGWLGAHAWSPTLRGSKGVRRAAGNHKKSRRNQTEAGKSGEMRNTANHM